jgi:sigma-B regulation protein RsbU (phosphoserine phosphatase)
VAADAKSLAESFDASVDDIDEGLARFETTRLSVCTPEKPVVVYALMEPAREVGGDLYDYFYASDHLFCFLVGDVSGKGASAAMFMARTRSLVRMALELSRQTGAEQMTSARVAEAVNRELCQNNDDRMFVTVFLGLLDTTAGVLAYTNAGHPVPHVLRASGEIAQMVCKPEMPLGVRSKVEYQTSTIVLRPGDAVFVISDGIVEAMNVDGELYSLERLNADLCGAAGVGAAELVRKVTENVNAFTGSAPKADDVTALALRWPQRKTYW